MAAPLLLVLARPLTLVLRTLPPSPLRRGLPAMAFCGPVRWMVFPPAAALLDFGGLWLLYRTGLFAAATERPLLHIAVHAHVLAAGLLFTFAVCQFDPVRHRHGLTLRGATLLAGGTAHAALAKSLYVSTPPGTAFGSADLHTGAQLMYYGGDLTELALAAAVAVQWYISTGRNYARHTAAAPVLSAGR
ncbi:cytochrome c oxidase assembly protein [Streptomyces sp. NPDC046557]|uniref:cytochrome c oxidase assembly protein n=1 Tax=Streptomyces sp. NPDC046557 TaxID=3155372 RepID=UPI0033F150EB